MANRRMFSLDVVDTDKFLDMPATSQSLYFHLGMRADDDGFISSPKRITAMVNCSADDLNVLISRGFVLQVGDGIVVIRHWRQNNYIQKDRKKPTIYQAELSLLSEKNGVYDLDAECIQNASGSYPKCIQSASNSDTQENIGKIKEDKIREEGKKERENAPREQKPNLEALFAEYGFSEKIEESLREWIQYKMERREGYKAQGLKSLLSQVKKKVEEYGEGAVCGLIEQCMGNGWQGIIWDKLSQKKPGTNRPTNRFDNYEQRRGVDYDALVAEMMTKQYGSGG